MKKVLFFSPGFAGPGRGSLTGGLISNYHFCQALKDRYTVDVLTIDDQINEGDYHHDGLNYIVSRVPPAGHRLYLPSTIRKHLRATFANYLELNPLPDLICCTAATVPLIGMPSLRACSRMIIARAFEDFGWGAVEAPLREQFRNQWDLVRRVPGTRRGYHEADCVLTNSHFMAGKIKEHFNARRTEVLYPCIDRGALGGSSSAGQAEKTIGFVSRNEGKNLEFIVSLATALPEWTFNIFGNAAELSSLNNIHYHGWEHDRTKMYASAQVWLVPSSWSEPFGRVAAEALGAGRQVLVSNRGGLPEAVGNVSELIVDSFDVTEWVQRIQAVCASKRAFEMPEAFDEASHQLEALRIVRSLVD